MNELAFRYTEEKYCTKQEISKHLSVSMIDPVWQEVLKYREPFMHTYKVVEPLSFCLCQSLILRCLKVHQNYRLVKKERKLEIEVLRHLFEKVPNEDALWMVYHWYQLDCDLAQMIHEAFILLQGKYEMQWKSLLMDEDILIECKWILLFSQCEDRVLAYCLFIGLCFHYDVLEIAMMLQDQVFFLRSKEEGTYALQYYLNTIEQKIAQELIQTHKTTEIELNTLKYIYPQLRDYQIDFYAAHHTKGYFYTLEQFMKYCHVCYETARSAMEQMVTLQFYQKLKQGKKFVYTRK